MVSIMRMSIIGCIVASRAYSAFVIRISRILAYRVKAVVTSSSSYCVALAAPDPKPLRITRPACQRSPLLCPVLVIAADALCCVQDRSGRVLSVAASWGSLLAFAAV
jgi:hypothetical protein